MRALVCREFGSTDELVIEELDDPVPASGEILLDVHAAGINFPDILVVGGQYQVKTPLPFIPGNEAAGIVAGVGDGVSRFAIGDKVIAMLRGGAFAEKCAVDEELVFPLPEQLNFAQGAGFSVTYGTSYHALRQSAQLQAGETLLVLGGAGGVGTTAIEIGKAMGARVIAAASNDEKLAFAKSVGADESINYSDTPLNDAVKELTAGAGADVVYDPVGGQLAQLALRATAWHGRYLVIGFASGEIPKFPANMALLKEASIIGVWWGTWAAKNPQMQVQNLQEMAALIADGRLNPKVTETYTLDEFKHAFRAISERKVKGKIVFTLA
jgi:NADPH2:quinone reductase